MQTRYVPRSALPRVHPAHLYFAFALLLPYSIDNLPTGARSMEETHLHKELFIFLMLVSIQHSHQMQTVLFVCLLALV